MWNSVVPPGLESFLWIFPALKRWAKLVRPYGGWVVVCFQIRVFLLRFTESQKNRFYVFSADLALA